MVDTDHSVASTFELLPDVPFIELLEKSTVPGSVSEHIELLLLPLFETRFRCLRIPEYNGLLEEECVRIELERAE